MMDKKVIIVFSGVVLLIGAAVLIKRFSAKPGGKSTPVDQATPAPTATTKLPSKQLNEHLDGSGFSFKYPDDLKLEEKEIDAETEYANLELVSPQIDGKVTLRVADTYLTALDGWVEKNRQGKTGKVSDLKLADLNAKEIKTPDKILTAALDQGAIISLEVLPQGNPGYWSKVYETLVSTFAFVLPEPAEAPAVAAPAAPTGEIIFLGEEIIE